MGLDEIHPDKTLYFSISRPSVSQAIKRSEKFAKENDIKLIS